MTIRHPLPECPVDPTLVDVLRQVGLATRPRNIDSMLVGATARDILLTHVFGLPAGRATRDVDLAIAVKDWDQFQELKDALLEQGCFENSAKTPHRLFYKGQEEVLYPLDLIPFGVIERPDSTIAWPPDMVVIMNVAGYHDVWAHSESVQLAPDLVLRVASIPGLAVLKLVAWSDRGRVNTKDAHDLFHMMVNYVSAGNLDRLYETEADVLEEAAFDPEMAGCLLLGRDAALYVTLSTLSQLQSIIDENFDRLLSAMIGANRFDDGTRTETCLRFFRAGLHQKS